MGLEIRIIPNSSANLMSRHIKCTWTRVLELSVEYLFRDHLSEEVSSTMTLYHASVSDTVISLAGALLGQ